MFEYPYNLLDFKYLNDGKLDKKFFDLFLLELLLDFLDFGLSFKLGEIRLLKYFTLPIGDTYKESGYYNFKYGSGKVNIDHIKNTTNSLKEISCLIGLFRCFKATKFIYYEDKK